MLAPTEADILEGTYASPVPVQRVLERLQLQHSGVVAGHAELRQRGRLPLQAGLGEGDGPEQHHVAPASYEGEIQATIKANGFFGLSAGASSGTVNQTPFDEYLAGGVPPHTAASLLGAYASYDAVVPEGNGDPTGFCQVYNTDGNSSP